MSDGRSRRNASIASGFGSMLTPAQPRREKIAGVGKPIRMMRADADIESARLVLEQAPKDHVLAVLRVGEIDEGVEPLQQRSYRNHRELRDDFPHNAPIGDAHHAASPRERA